MGKQTCTSSLLIQIKSGKQNILDEILVLLLYCCLNPFSGLYVKKVAKKESLCHNCSLSRKNYVQIIQNYTNWEKASIEDDRQ